MTLVSLSSCRDNPLTTHWASTIGFKGLPGKHLKIVVLPVVDIDVSGCIATSVVGK